jgi:TRAP-type C4-dicarboxylate transport system substrate-binding protein
MKYIKKKWRINEIYKIFNNCFSFINFVNKLAIAEKWDMALAYGAGNFHSANATEFAKNVTEKSGGKLNNRYSPWWFII